MIQVMAWCCQAASHYLRQYWPRSMSPYGVTSPQSVEGKCLNIDGLVQDCSNSIANALELLQSCTKPSISCIIFFLFHQMFQRNDYWWKVGIIIMYQETGSWWHGERFLQYWLIVKGIRWFPAQRDSNVELYFLCCQPDQAVKPPAPPYGWEMIENSNSICFLKYIPKDKHGSSIYWLVN